MPRPIVTIVGAGFSGLLTALHLLADPDGPQVRLVERRRAFGRGVAYATASDEHLLNVRIGNMSAFPDQPDHFARWLSANRSSAGAGGFVTRGIYGEYLQSLLRQAVEGAFGINRLLLEFDEVVDLQRAGGRWRAETNMGRTLWSEAMVLATGSTSASRLPGAGPDVLASERYIADPWRAGALETELGERILLVGSGLTMVDVALALERPGRRLVSMSRRGLSPRRHSDAAPRPGRCDLSGSPLAILAQIRGAALQRDWREVVDEVRGSAASLWRGWSPEERRRFLRHLRPWWDVHRHRMAPPVAQRIATMQDAGALSIVAGSLQEVAIVNDEVAVTWRRRGEDDQRCDRFDAVINCTGRGGDLRSAEEPLLNALLRRGLIAPDPCRLGAEVDDQCQLLDARGEPGSGLFAVGPLTRGAFWEITSVPDIRLQARFVAGQIAGRLVAEPQLRVASA